MIWWRYSSTAFADEEIIIALGVTLDGQKIPLGFVQAATENERVCRRFLSDLVEPVCSTRLERIWY